MSKLTRFMKNHRRATVIVILAAILLAGTSGVLALKANKAPVVSQAESNVTVLALRDLDQVITARGTIQSVLEQPVSTLLTAKVTDIRVAVGDVVQAGDVLAQLDTRDYEENLADIQANIKTADAQQKAQISQAARKVADARDQKTIDSRDKQKTVDQAAATLRQAKADAKANARAAGDAAVEAAVMADPAVVNAKAVLGSAQNNMNREKLALIGSADPDTAAYDQAVTVYRAALSEYNDTVTAVRRQNWDAVRKAASDQSSQASQAAIDAARKAYDQAVTNRQATVRADQLAIQDRANALTNQKLNDPTATLESQLATARQNLADTTVTAPVSGTVTAVLATLGARANGSLFVIQDTQTLEIATTVAEYDVPKLHESQPVRFTSAATADDPLTGTIRLIAPTAVNENGDFDVLVRIDQPDQRLRIGMNAKLTIVLDSRPSIFAVPYDAVTINAAGDNVVTALRKDGVTRYEIPVTIGMETDYYVEISSPDLAAGLEILNDPSGKNVTPAASGVGGPFSGGN